jgi:hypothetical protein
MAKPLSPVTPDQVDQQNPRLMRVQSDALFVAVEYTRSYPTVALEGAFLYGQVFRIPWYPFQFGEVDMPA